MLITSTGVLAVVLCVIVLVGWFETAKVEAKLRETSENELKSLNALVSSAMEQRVDDSKDVAIRVFNRWFDHRNADYPGKLWSVWSPQMANFMAQMAASADKSAPARASKPPRDAIDEEALRTGRPVGRFVGDSYRFSLPVVLGITPGTDQASCYACHGATMNLTKGQVLSTFSSSLSTTAEFSALRRLLWQMAGASLAGTAVLILAIWMVFRRVISRRLTSMTAAMRRLAEGDQTVEVPPQRHQDEIAGMAGAVEVFKSHMIENQRLAAEQEDARLQADRDKSAALHGMADKIEAATNSALDQIGQRTTVVAATADDMNASASRTGAAAQSAAEAADQAVANAQTVASAAEQLASSIQEIGGQVSRSTTVVGQAVAAGGQARATIEALNTKVERIGAVADMIREIASKTNLLALNATIEAARAGDAGKGFAVVASEVKSLATQTAKATEEIGSKVAEMQAATAQSVDAVRAIGETISEINEVCTTIAAAVEEQGAATKEIARNVQQASAGTTEVSANVAGISQAAASTGDVAVRVRTTSQKIGGEVGTLRSQVQTFLATVNG